MYKYCLFDLDGTLTDPKEGICKSVQYALHKMGIEESNLDKLEPFIGPPLKTSFSEFYGMSDEEVEKAVAAYRERFSAVGLYENEIYEGIEEMLDCLKDLGVKLAVASSKPTVFVDKILEHFKIADYFDVVVGSNLDGTRSEKAEVVEEALLCLYYGKEHGDRSLSDCEKQKAQTAMIGDRRFDIEGAHAMGIAGIGVDYGYSEKGELRSAGADKIAKDVTMLTEILTGVKTKKSKTVNLEKISNRDVENKEKQAGKKNTFLLERNENSLPTSSFQKSIYVLTPFLLYYMVMLAVLLIGRIVIDEIKMGDNEVIAESLVANSWFYSGGLNSLSMLVAVVVLLGIYHKTDRMCLKWDKRVPMIPLAGAMLALGLNLIVSFICQAVPSLQTYLENSTYNKEMPMMVGLIAFGFISPIAEEVCFRYLMYGRMKRIYGATFALIVSSLFFGLYHGHWLQAIYAVTMGIGLALVYEWSGTFIAPVIFHMAANICIYILPFSPEVVRKVLCSPIACVLWIILGVGSMVAIKMQSNELVQ